MSLNATQGRKFGLQLNQRKCKVYWPTGNQEFMELPPEVAHLTEGVSLLGSLIWGSPEYMSSCVAKLVCSVETMQEKILDLMTLKLSYTFFNLVQEYVRLIMCFTLYHLMQCKVLY